MDKPSLLAKLDELLLNWEDEVTEFKRAGSDFDTDKLGRYFSALANEANLRDTEDAWFVLGVDNKTRKVVGTNYREDAERLQSIKQQVAQGAAPSISFIAVYELDHPDGRVILFRIPPAPRAIPISWKGHYYARAGESLTSLSLAKLDELRAQQSGRDWTGLPAIDATGKYEATINDLDEEAVATARRGFIAKHSNSVDAEEVASWTPMELLRHAHLLTTDGKISRAALILLGKPATAISFFPGSTMQITWYLKGEEEAYEHFSLPFITATTKTYERIRNVQIRLLPADSLIAHEIPKYDRRVLLEAIHNCIAHQDYARLSRITVTEHIDKVTFDSAGEFFEGTPEDFALGRAPARRYRNPTLVRGMVNFNMIDQMGFGIRRMYRTQAKRYMPLPDYEAKDGGVVLTMYGAVVDEAYSEALMANQSLNAEDVLALDRVQKGLFIDGEITKRLRRRGLVEGKRPKLRVAPAVAAATGREADYVKAFVDEEHFSALVLKLVEQFSPVDRAKVREALWDRLPSELTDEQKSNKIANTLSRLGKKSYIIKCGSNRNTLWYWPGTEPAECEPS